MLRIRLARTGAAKQASYRIVVIEQGRARNSRPAETIGHYNPRRRPVELVVNWERAAYWLGKGAQPSETVRSFLKKAPPAAKAPEAASLAS